MARGRHRSANRDGPRKRVLVAVLAALAAAVAVPIALAAAGGTAPEPVGAARSPSAAGSPGTPISGSSSGVRPAGPARVSPSPASSPSGNVWAAITPKQLSPAVAHDPELVYVPNTKSGTVDEIDPRTFKVVRQLQVGGVPHHITPSWDLRHLYVDNLNGVLTVINPRTGGTTGAVRVSDAYNLYFTPDGTRALVVNEYERAIEFRDPHTWKLLRKVSIPWAGVDHLDFSADGSYLLVSCEYSGEVVRVNASKMTVTGQLHVGGSPIDVKLSSDGRVFFVANQGLGGVSVIDPLKLRQVAFINTGAGAHGFAVSRNARSLYVSNRLAGTISVISLRTRRVTATWNVGGSPDMLQVSPDGAQLWASNRFGDTVSVISTRDGRVLHTIHVGTEPHGLTFFPQPGRFSLGHNGVYR